MFRPLVLIVTGVLALSVLAQVTVIPEDFSTISGDATILLNALNAVPSSGATLSQALSVHTAANTLSSALSLGTSHAEAASPIPISGSDGSTVDNLATALVPTLIAISQGYIAKRNVFVALPVGGILALAKQDIGNLHTNILAFYGALIQITAPPYQDDLINDRDELDWNWTTAYNDY